MSADAQHAGEARHASASRLRLFCAVELPPEIRARAVEHITRLRERLPHVRAGWERLEKLHLTLKFFGDVEESRAAALSQAIERSAKRAAPFPLIVAGAGAFPPRGPARVLWLGIRDASGHLSLLHTTLEDECAAAGFAREQRAFHPHLTLARLRTPAGARSLAELHSELGFEPMELHVNELVLMRSELGPRGSRYTALTHHGLAL
jgi:2'-5' RNA ligase